MRPKVGQFGLGHVRSTCEFSGDADDDQQRRGEQ
jgi:hypothetical protein